MAPRDLTVDLLPSASRPAAIVLSGPAATGLATVRALASTGVEVHAVVFDAYDPVRFSRHARTTRFPGRERDRIAVARFVHDCAQRVGARPVVIPTSDEQALMLAEHAQALQPVCRIWTTGHRELERLVKKDQLYALAADAGLRIVPSIFGASLEQIAAWSVEHAGPYLLKPSYVGVDGCPLRMKNLVVPDRAALLDAVARLGVTALVIQQLLAGGDGEIYDVYGLCDARGTVLSLASHRRIRQHRPNLGATCYGAIPSGLGALDGRLFEDTRRLLAATRFHGIFGVEWLRQRSTGTFCLIDFNARPFLSIGHLHDCGVNLPALAYRELIGEDLSSTPLFPAVRPRIWVDLLADIRTRLAGTSAQHRSLPHWLLSLTRASSHAYWNWRDPGPGLKRAVEIAYACARHALRRARASLAPSAGRHRPGGLRFGR